MPTVLLVRHAQASYGAADYDVLSPLGHEQTEALVAGLGRRRAITSHVVSGTLRRQRETANRCADAARVEARIDARWDEYDDADVLQHHSSSNARVSAASDGGGPVLDSREFQRIVDDALGRWVRAGTSSPCRQSWPDFSATSWEALHKLTAGLAKGETALVVSSSGAIAAVAIALLGLPAEALVRFNHVSVNTGITKLVVGRSGISLVSFNEHVHLDELGTKLVTYR